MSKTYVIEVDGVGAFEVRRRTMSVVAAVGAEYNRLTEGQDVVSDFFARFCNMLATLKVLVVKGPSGWDVENLDPDDPAEYSKMSAVFAEILNQERSFRLGIQARGQDAGSGGGAEP